MPSEIQIVGNGELTIAGVSICCLYGNDTKNLLLQRRVGRVTSLLLRPIHITATQLEPVLGMAVNAPDQAAPRASGPLEAHYAPRTPVAMVAVEDLERTITQLLAAGKRVAVMAYQPHTANAQLQGWRQLNPDPVSYAHDLYADLRELDHVGADIILVEALPIGREWQGVADRLRRAAFDFQGILGRLLLA